MRRIFVVTRLLILLMLAFVLLSPAYGHSGVSLSAWTSTPPTIDGIIGIDEWSSADTETFTMGTRSGIVYVMNDDTNLYLAVEIEDEEFSGDMARFYFDNDHDDVKLEEGDDNIVVRSGGDFLDMVYTILPTGPTIAYDTNVGGTNDGVGGSTGDGTRNYFEFKHPLDSDDDLHDFSLSFGDTVGFCFGYYDKEPNPEWAYWPAGYINDPWHNIVIASFPERPVGGFEAPINTLALLAPWIIMILATSFGAVFATKRKNH